MSMLMIMPRKNDVLVQVCKPQLKSITKLLNREKKTDICSELNKRTLKAKPKCKFCKFDFVIESRKYCD